MGDCEAESAGKQSSRDWQLARVSQGQEKRLWWSLEGSAILRR